MVDVCVSGDDDSWVALGAAHARTAANFIVDLIVVKGPTASLSSPPATPAAGAGSAAQHRLTAEIHVVLASTAACE